MITKGVLRTVEYGDYDNFGTLIPEEVKIEKCGTEVYAIITYKYDESSDRTIDLCTDDIDKIDYESFNTTKGAELGRRGLKPDEVQVFRGRTYVIKDEDGVIRPFKNFTVEFDYVTPVRYLEPAHKTIKCEVRSTDGAIKYVKRCVLHPEWMQNIKVICED